MQVAGDSTCSAHDPLSVEVMDEEEYEHTGDNGAAPMHANGQPAEVGVETLASATHADVWDDGALIEAWEAAKQEYMEYHSLTPTKKKNEERHNLRPKKSERRQQQQYDHNSRSPSTQGRSDARPPDVTSNLESVAISTNGDPANVSRATVSSSAACPEVHDAEMATTTSPPPSNQQLPGSAPRNENEARDAYYNGDKYHYYTPYGVPPVVPSLNPGETPPADGSGPVQMVEGLSNLLMSWYFAGYYTGLYQGRHGS